MIIRRKRNDYEATPKKPRGLTERHRGDTDLTWTVDGTTHSVYVLDVHECWVENRRRLPGPSVIVVHNRPSHTEWTEYHVNDPTVWAWVSRSIREGYLSPETIAPGLHERDIPLGPAK